MPAQSIFRPQNGAIVLVSDTNRGSTVIVSRDQGRTWVDPGGKIAGIHAGVVQSKDGHLMAFGRGDNIDGKMPKSISADMGKTWIYTASEFPPISGGQRLILTHLQEGPLFFASFAPKVGLFGTLSFDEGKTWPVKRLITDGKPNHEVERMDGHLFTMGPTSAEPSGYMSVCQTADGVIQLITSRQHYAFNVSWLRANDGVVRTTNPTLASATAISRASGVTIFSTPAVAASPSRRVLGAQYGAKAAPRHRRGGPRRNASPSPLGGSPRRQRPLQFGWLERAELSLDVANFTLEKSRASV
jgi:hypothetical protein